MKQKPNKLDGHEERLRDMLLPKEEGGRALTYDQAVEALRLDGLKTSPSELSRWFVREQSRRLQERLLGQIASGAKQCREVEQELAKNPAPELETLIKLHRVLILNLSTKGTAEPEYLELVNRMMREVQKFARLQQLGKQNELEERRVAMLEKQAGQAEEARLVTASELRPEEKMAKIKQIFGMS